METKRHLLLLLTLFAFQINIGAGQAQEQKEYYIESALIICDKLEKKLVEQQIYVNQLQHRMGVMITIRDTLPDIDEEPVFSPPKTPYATLLEEEGKNRFKIYEEWMKGLFEIHLLEFYDVNNRIAAIKGQRSIFNQIVTILEDFISTLIEE